MVVACQTTATDTCLRMKPMVLRMANSWRRRRTELTRACTSVAAAIRASSEATARGVPAVRSRLARSLGFAGWYTFPPKVRPRRPKTAALFADGAYRTRMRL